MRHGKKFNHLGRKKGHRSALLSNMSCSLIEHKRINTTVAKAKALRVYIEPIITRSKTDSTHSRRMVFRQLKSKEATAELFRDVAPVVADRPGGYTRIIKTMNRLGDNADMCMIELVDFNELMKEDTSTKKGRSRRGGKKTTAKTTTPVATSSKEENVETKAEVKDEVVETKAETIETKEEVVDSKAEVKEEVVAKEAKVETPEAEVKEEPKEEKTETPKAKAKEDEASKEDEKKEDSDKKDS